MSELTARRGFHLLDLAALVVGYSLASLLVRAFWPADGTADPRIVVALGLEYLWLGLAMSGPVVLLFHRRPDPTATAEAEDSDQPVKRTWAELAWLIIGFYWIGMTVLIVPVRLRETRLFDSAILGVFPIAAAFALRFIKPRRASAHDQPPAWTHHAGVGLLMAWPIAWIALILLGKTLL